MVTDFPVQPEGRVIRTQISEIPWIGQVKWRAIEKVAEDWSVDMERSFRFSWCLQRSLTLFEMLPFAFADSERGIFLFLPEEFDSSPIAAYFLLRTVLSSAASAGIASTYTFLNLQADRTEHRVRCPVRQKRKVSLLWWRWQSIHSLCCFSPFVLCWSLVTNFLIGFKTFCSSVKGRKHHILVMPSPRFCGESL